MIPEQVHVEPRLISPERDRTERPVSVALQVPRVVEQARAHKHLPPPKQVDRNPLSREATPHGVERAPNVGGVASREEPGSSKGELLATDPGPKLTGGDELCELGEGLPHIERVDVGGPRTPGAPVFLGAGDLPEESQPAPEAPVDVEHQARQLISAEISRQCAEVRVIEALVLGPRPPPNESELHPPIGIYLSGCHHPWRTESRR
jgi:hypothetical protein